MKATIKFDHIPTLASGPDASKVLMIYTGGTMGMYKNPHTGSLTPLSFDQLTHKLPEIYHSDFHLSIISFLEPIDSSNFRPDKWIQLAKVIYEYYDRYDGFVILHGTDTMAYTASALSFMLQNLSKPIIFTGSQLPLGERRNDARENILGALEFAKEKAGSINCVPEVCIYFSHLLLRGNRAKKDQSNDFTAFESPNYPPLAEAGIEIRYNRNNIKVPSQEPLQLFDQLEENIIHIRISPALSVAHLQQILSIKGLKAVILETYGSGNAPNNVDFIETIHSAIKKGIIFFNVSQCHGGRVVQGKYETSTQLKNIGVISGKDITIEAAYIKLMHGLVYQDTKEKLEKFLLKDVVGEIFE